jgi:NADPH-dependent methylglyoxal reductase
VGYFKDLAMVDTLLVTGANGYVALHVIKEALAQGYEVVGTVRSVAAAEKITAIFPNSSSQLAIVEVHDITKPSDFEKAFEKFKIGAVINTASPLINNPKDVKADVLDPAIKSGVAILEASAKYAGPQLRRVIHVGSFASTLDLSLGVAPGKTYSPSDWNQLTYEEAANGGHSTAYIGSKALAEKRMWQWMKENTPTFDMVSVDPAAIFGPHVGPIDLDRLNISTQMLWELVVPSPNPPPYNSGHLGAWVDVRDVSAALLAAVKVPEAGGERFLAAQRCHWQLVRDEARRVLPELQNRIDAGEPGAWLAAQTTTYDVDGSKVTKILGVQYTLLGECLKDSYQQLLEVEKLK